MVRTRFDPARIARSPRTRAALVAALGAVVAACGGEERSTPGATTAAPEPASSAAAPASPAEPRPAAGEGPTVVFLGDSLTAGFGLAAEQAYPALVARRLAERGLAVRAINAGVSGDTTAGGLSRLDWLLSQRPAILFVCLGANDGLRGLPLDATESNLRAIVERSKSAGVRVVLAGMQIPPNYGPAYASAFRAIYTGLAEEYELDFVPFLLEGVAADPALNLPDGIHPNARGQEIVAETVARALEPVLKEAKG